MCLICRPGYVFLYIRALRVRSKRTRDLKPLHLRGG